ncbi:acyl-phosphate glycerol 3-phosphate acyltransferase [Candidatus Riesia sp. GBBU]|nr:acyl-phosphate glycerol 3-phosphate acyltransferase [Candidatus Riesia sp. GBBU]
MLAIFRIIVTIVFSLIICVIGFLYCLFNIKNLDNVRVIGRIFGKLSYIFGIRIITRIPRSCKNLGPCVYISNHQNNYDMIILSNVIQNRTITVGKKSLLFIPFFGLLYWMSGNVLIERKNKIRSYRTILKIVKKIKRKKISVWIFPEGTRNKDEKLLEFKNGAFIIAMLCNIPIVPICLSETNNKIKINKFNNGKVIIEMLDPIYLNSRKFNKKKLQLLKIHCYKLMKSKIEELSRETK